MGPNNGQRRDIFVARSGSPGGGWSETTILNSNSGIDDVDDSYSRLDTDGQGNWVAVWISYDPVAGFTSLFAARSVDAGDTWSEAVPVNVGSPLVENGSTLSPFVRAERVPGGRWMIAWDGGGAPALGQNNLFNILYVVSEDGGETWSVPKSIGRPIPTGSGGRWPSLTPDNQGKWIGVWTSFEDFERKTDTDGEIFFARIAEAGETDINQDGVVNAVDVQLVINAVLGIPIPVEFEPDVNGDASADAVDVQTVINAVLGAGS